MLIGADDDKSSSAVWLTQRKFAEAQCVGSTFRSTLAFATFLRTATREFGEWGSVRVRGPCWLALRLRKVHVEAWWSDAGQAVCAKISIWEALHI